MAEASGITLADVVARMDERFDRVDERFDRVDERFERVDERFDRTDEKVAEKFAVVDERFDRVNEGFALLNERIDGEKELIAGVRSQLERVEGRLTHFDKRFDSLQWNLVLVLVGFCTAVFGAFGVIAALIAIRL